MLKKELGLQPVLKASVVINTVNRASSLEDTLRSVIALDYEAFEIIVVNGPSTDHTADILEKYKKSIKIAECTEHNLSMSRNVGIACSSGDFVAFIDDDAAPHPTWLTKLGDQYRRPNVGAVGGFTVDKTGVRWQSRKTICDRYGDAYYVDNFFDERPLNRIKTPFYPSLLGTNSSFRRSALIELKGFDHTFAYLLDETDVCLRMVDLGYEVVYEPDAIVYHKGAASDRRSSDWTPKTLLPSARSKSYFIMRHGSKQSVDEATEKLRLYKEEILRANEWLRENGRISWEHGSALNIDLMKGIEEGTSQAFKRGDHLCGDLELTISQDFKPVKNDNKFRVVLVSRTFPPGVDAGIARWTNMVAAGLAGRGWIVHVITEANDKTEEKVVFEDGIWLHSVSVPEVNCDDVSMAFDVPYFIAGWIKRVKDEVDFIKTFGPLVLSFPIWDVEGLACLQDTEIGVVMSLHTSYAMAKPFKKEWTYRKIFEKNVYERMVRAELRALQKAPVILANSNAIIKDLSDAYTVDFNDRVVLAPHGTEDLLVGKIQINHSERLRVLFVGRYEDRKGFDVVIKTALSCSKAGIPIDLWLSGGELTQSLQVELASLLREGDPVRVVQYGVLPRHSLEDLYRTCDLVLMPSRYESFGLVAIEAMSASKPVISFDAGGLKEIIDNGVNGFRISVDDNAVVEIVSCINKIDKNRSLLESLSCNARKTYEQRYTVDNMIDKVMVAYHRAYANAYAKDSFS